MGITYISLFCISYKDAEIICLYLLLTFNTEKVKKQQLEYLCLPNKGVTGAVYYSFRGIFDFSYLNI